MTESRKNMGAFDEKSYMEYSTSSFLNATGGSVLSENERCIISYPLFLVWLRLLVNIFTIILMVLFAIFAWKSPTLLAGAFNKVSLGHPNFQYFFGILAKNSRWEKFSKLGDLPLNSNFKR